MLEGVIASSETKLAQLQRTVDELTRKLPNKK
jgi:hypothetical protein